MCRTWWIRANRLWDRDWMSMGWRIFFSLNFRTLGAVSRWCMSRVTWWEFCKSDTLCRRRISCIGCRKQFKLDMINCSISMSTKCKCEQTSWELSWAPQNLFNLWIEFGNSMNNKFVRISGRRNQCQRHLVRTSLIPFTMSGRYAFNFKHLRQNPLEQRRMSVRSKVFYFDKTSEIPLPRTKRKKKQQMFENVARKFSWHFFHSPNRNLIIRFKTPTDFAAQ